ncbi:MAG: N-acetylneuraminate synthase family protein [Phycisphaeraceae bacterium]
MAGVEERVQKGGRLVFSAADATRPAVVAVVAEIGVNHDGDTGVARRLIDASAQAGADAVKFQYFRPERLLSNQAELAGYQKGKAASQRALLEPLALSIDELGRLVEHARGCGLAAVVTPFSPDDPAELSPLGLDAIKTASPDAVNPPLLRACAALGLPMLVSTGACALDELGGVAALLCEHPAGGALLHCVSSYPTPMGGAQLGGIGVMIDRLNLPVGYSDHTSATHTGALAVLAGAVVLEKHLTHDRSAAGPDHAASLDPEGLRAYVAAVREAQRALGVRDKSVTGVERDVRRVSRQSLCVLHDLPAGHVLTASDLTVKRPGTGLSASEWDTAVGRRLARRVSANDVLWAEDLCEPAG